MCIRDRGGVDAIIFTGGIGENDAKMRFDIASDMEYLGLTISEQLNKDASGKDMTFSIPESKVKAYVIPTNEEMMIALDTEALIKR